MNSIESKCQKLLSSISGGDVETYKRLRTSIVAEISDYDYRVTEFEDKLAVGEALVIILDDISHSGVIYKRIVLIAMLSLLKQIINDKNGNNPQTSKASSLLLILFSENRDFVGGEYLVSKLRSADTAVHQYIGMTYVFYWHYKFNASKPILLHRSEQRLQEAITNTPLDTPDVSTRQKVIDFEYDNFNSMIHDLPLDVVLKYTGLPFDPELLFPKIQSMFNSELSYFKNTNLSLNNQETITSGDSINKQVNQTSSKVPQSSSGCLGLVILIIVASVIIACSL